MDYLSKLAFCLFVLTLSVFAWIVFWPGELLLLIVITLSTVLALVLQIRAEKRGDILVDERRESKRNRATRLSWFLTIEMVALAFILHYLNIIQVSFEVLAFTVVGFMIGSELFIEHYTYGRGEP